MIERCLTTATVTRFSRTLLATAVASVISMSAMAEPMSEAELIDSIEEIEVTGIRRSLSAAADMKRDDARIVDAIVAEDIGKLPDNNIAEALQRVTGVSINRDFGVGSEVSIRGLPQNRVELNGRSTLGDDRNGVDFQDFPSSFLSAVEVVKSPTPEMIEGALGGTISMKTVRPLDLKEPVTAMSLDAEYADKADHWAPIFNASAGDIWDLGDAGTLGVTAMVSHQDRTLRRDTSEVSLFVFDDIDINQDGVVNSADAALNTPTGHYVVPTEHKFEPFTEERERTALNLSFQWAPTSEKGNFYLDLNTTDRSGGQEAYSILHAGENPVATADSYEDANGALNNYRAESPVIIPKSWSEFRETESSSFALGGEWDFTDKLKVSGEISTAESKSNQPRSEFNWRAIDPVAEAANPSASNEYRPDADIIVSDGSAPSVVYVGGNPYLQTENLAFREYRARTRDTDNEEDALRLDVEYFQPGDLEWFSSFKTGLRVTDRSYERSESEYRVKDIHKNLRDADGNPIVIWQDDIAALYPGAIIVPDVTGDAFEHAGIAGESHLTEFSVYDARQLQNQERTFGMVQQLLAGTNLASTGNLSDNLRESTAQYAFVEEDTFAFYAQANLDFENVQIVLGGRYVKTELTSTAYNQAGDALVSDKGEYSDFLPSINATIHLSDSTLMRFAGAKVMRRPDFNQLSPTFEFNSDLITADRGNPNLDPFRATQFDISLEHYFGEGNMVSATIFYKDVSSFLKDTLYCADLPDEVLSNQNHSIPGNVCIRPSGSGDSASYSFTEDPAELAAYVAEGRNGVLTTTVTNGQSGTIEGFEIGYQQAFDFLPGLWSGLGVNANYTYSDSEDPDGVPLQDISENSYNFQLYWEYGGFGVRLAYTFRDNFLDETGQKRTARVGEQVSFLDPESSDPTQGTDFRDDLEQWDLSANWDINDNFSVVASINNLTAEPTVNQSITGTTWQVRETDRRFNLGLRAKF